MESDDVGLEAVTELLLVWSWRGRLSDIPLDSETLLAFLFREASGSLMKTHSFPRVVHFEQGCWRLHLTFDSAHA